MARAPSKRKKTIRTARRASGFDLIPLDSWFKAKHFVHYEIESKDWLKAVKDYIRKNCDKTTVKNINCVADWKVGYGSHWATVAVLLDRNPSIIPEGYTEKFLEFIKKLSDEGSEIQKEKTKQEKTVKKLHVPTIQERITEQVYEACQDIEDWLEGFIVDCNTFDSNAFDIKSHFSKMNITQAHARKILARYQNRLDEARGLVNKPTPAQISKIKDPVEKDHAEQFREGYSHINKQAASTYLEALEKLAGACMLVIDASKAKRKPRAKKSPSKEKLVAKLKYKQIDEKYQIASINPTEMIESTEIWVFNTKNRKLGRYIAADDSKVMTVKGNSIIGFDQKNSIQKTLRKPEDVLKEVKSAGKIKLRKFLDDIKTTETKLNGRLNSDTLIIRANR